MCLYTCYSNAANYTIPANRTRQYRTKSVIIFNSLLIFGLNYCKKQKTDIIGWFSVSGADMHILKDYPNIFSKYVFLTYLFKLI